MEGTQHTPSLHCIPHLAARYMKLHGGADSKPLFHRLAGDKLLSRAVNWMIASKPIFGVMKAAAKAVMKRASRRAGMDWDAHAQQMQQTAEVRPN